MLNNNFSEFLICETLYKFISAFDHKQFITLHPDSWVNSTICALRIFWNGSIHRPEQRYHGRASNPTVMQTQACREILATFALDQLSCDPV